MHGTLTNGHGTIPWSNPNAPTHTAWVKGSDTDLDPIVKDSVIVAALPNALSHSCSRIADGTRLVGISDDKAEDSPVLEFSRVEFTIFAQAVKDGQFDEFFATEQEMKDAGKVPAGAEA